MKIVFFGDSVCFGQRTSPHLTWVSRISFAIDCIANGTPVVVVNSSVNGNTTRLALERIGADLQNENPDLVYIQFGLNDCNFWQSDNGHPRVSLRAYESNLQEIIDRARLSNASKVLIATNHPTVVDGIIEQKISRKALRPYRDNIIMYNDAVRRVATDTGAHLIDIEKAWIAGPEAQGVGQAFLDPDGLHLSRLGHDFYFDLLAPHFLRDVGRFLRPEGVGNFAVPMPGTTGATVLLGRQGVRRRISQ
jgi:lysophospholipase L1-like esterase